jgi:hypothetical protein
MAKVREEELLQRQLEETITVENATQERNTETRGGEEQGIILNAIAQYTRTMSEQGKIIREQSKIIEGMRKMIEENNQKMEEMREEIAKSNTRSEELQAQMNLISQELALRMSSNIPSNSYAAVARTPPDSQASVPPIPVASTTPSSMVDKIYCTIDISRIQEEERKRITTAEVKRKVENKIKESGKGKTGNA